jgi:hypothetical protein
MFVDFLYVSVIVCFSETLIRGCLKGHRASVMKVDCGLVSAVIHDIECEKLDRFYSVY